MFRESKRINKGCGFYAAVNYSLLISSIVIKNIIYDTPADDFFVITVFNIIVLVMLSFLYQKCYAHKVDDIFPTTCYLCCQLT